MCDPSAPVEIRLTLFAAATALWLPFIYIGSVSSTFWSVSDAVVAFYEEEANEEKNKMGKETKENTSPLRHNTVLLTHTHRTSTTYGAQSTLSSHNRFCYEFITAPRKNKEK